MAGEDFSQRASHDRLSAITDGVYAVALTLLALEIVVPSANSIHSSAQLNNYMVNNLLPQLSLYLISFIILSNFWASTNAIPMYKKVDNTILTINLAILALVVLIPFSTSFVLSFWSVLIPPALNCRFLRHTRSVRTAQLFCITAARTEYR